MAFHFNKPMIVTDVGGLPEIVHDGKTGWVVQRNPESIARAIRKSYDPGIIDSFVKAVEIEKKKYDWKHMVEGVFALTATDPYANK
jgi:glycosyltransferase involved in cell wall biosynthesis